MQLCHQVVALSNYEETCVGKFDELRDEEEPGSENHCQIVTGFFGVTHLAKDIVLAKPPVKSSFDENPAVEGDEETVVPDKDLLHLEGLPVTHDIHGHFDTDEVE